MRVLFAGSPAIAVPTLLEIARAHEVVAVLTNPDAPGGRGREMASTEVAAAARSHFGRDFPVLSFERLGPAEREAVSALHPDILLAFAYGKIFGPKFLALFPRGGINVHPSLLPRHRGPSPIQQAILERDAQTGVSVQKIALEMDAGDLLAVRVVSLSGSESVTSLSETCAALGASLAREVLDSIQEGSAVATPQAGIPTYCSKLTKEDGLIDWSMSSAQIDARIRAFEHWPVAYTLLDGQRLNILEAEPCIGSEFPDPVRGLPIPVPGTILGIDKTRGILVKTGDDCIALRRLQFASRKALFFKDFINGARNLSGRIFGS